MVLCGSELDEIRVSGRDNARVERIDHVQKALASRVGLNREIQSIILNYSDLDEFLKVNYGALNEYYSYGKS
jgi:hypothetical protein